MAESIWGLQLARRVSASVRRNLMGGAHVTARSAPGTAVPQVRETVSDWFLSGEGIEIGALHQPLKVPSSARVTYVDRMPAAELRVHYSELAGFSLVETDIVDNGEELRKFADGTQNFVIANHFIEHCQNPIRTLQNFERVLKPGGVIFLAVPDKRFTFDIDRPSTTLDHVLRDFSEGPAWSKRQHFEEWSRLVNKRSGPELDAEVQHLMEIDYSIHFHVWQAPELCEFVGAVQGFARIELELFLRNGPETIVVFRKPAG